LPQKILIDLGTFFSELKNENFDESNRRDNFPVLFQVFGKIMNNFLYIWYTKRVRNLNNTPFKKRKIERN